jgi:hypothetical protein
LVTGSRKGSVTVPAKVCKPELDAKPASAGFVVSEQEITPDPLDPSIPLSARAAKAF